VGVASQIRGLPAHKRGRWVSSNNNTPIDLKVPRVQVTRSLACSLIDATQNSGVSLLRRHGHKRAIFEFFNFFKRRDIRVLIRRDPERGQEGAKEVVTCSKIFLIIFCSFREGHTKRSLPVPSSAALPSAAEVSVCTATSSFHPS
jgi:hypothetical protein